MGFHSLTDKNILFRGRIENQSATIEYWRFCKSLYFKCFGITAVGFDSVVLTLKVIIGFNINIVILLWESAKAFRPGWPDLVNFRHFGKNLEIYGNIFKINFIFGQVLNPYWYNFYALGQVSSLLMAKYWKTIRP